MPNRLPIFFLIIVFALNISSCALHFHDDPLVAQELDPKAMDRAFDYAPSSIKPYQCQKPCEIALINAEARTAKYLIWDAAHSASYTPQKFAGTVISYMGDEFARRGIKLNSESPKRIMVSLGEARIDYRPFSQKSNFELKIAIPDLNYQKSYQGSDASIYWHTALAYSVHHSVMEFMKDPVVVKYIESKP
jgi:hypothetical protein